MIDQVPTQEFMDCLWLFIIVVGIIVAVPIIKWMFTKDIDEDGEE